MYSSFEAAPLPQLLVGEQVIEFLPQFFKSSKITDLLLCIGGRSLDRSGLLEKMLNVLQSHDIACSVERITAEPSPECIDSITDRYADSSIQGVLGIGGGSVIDAANAVSAMLAESREAGERVSVVHFLEGVGDRKPSGKRIGLTVVPTTAGTGSEATKNAVISRVGVGGFKKSLRHIGYIPDAAVLDGRFSVSAPQVVTAASGLDAVTQLLEAYVSKKACPFTDLLAVEGLQVAGRVLPALVRGESAAEPGERTKMAYAAYLSGVCLANANLGLVHGASSVLGSMHAVPHGVVCGTLLYEASLKIIAEAKERFSSDNRAETALKKYSRAGFALAGSCPLPGFGSDIEKGLTFLEEILFSWQNSFMVPGLGEYGFIESELAGAAAETGMKETPVPLSPDDIFRLFKKRLR
ncbi:MAG: iron-containing alcohol dehydrogenase [Spirochaetales bacterium]|jgi:alcohol dehydrogenase class IV|nr:iron-containing alcohol dehydrogenase [Spirochaetales bacterium]